MTDAIPPTARGVVNNSHDTYARNVTLANSSGSETASTSGSESKQVRSGTYAEGGLSKFYEPIPEYEGRHRWDPHAEWTEGEEKKLVRKVSSHLAYDISPSSTTNTRISLTTESVLGRV
jgi:hypothetical protein